MHTPTQNLFSENTIEQEKLKAILHMYFIFMKLFRRVRLFHPSIETNHRSTTPHMHACT